MFVEHVDVKTIELPMIWDAMELMRHKCSEIILFAIIKRCPDAPGDGDH